MVVLGNLFEKKSSAPQAQPYNLDSKTRSDISDQYLTVQHVLPCRAGGGAESKSEVASGVEPQKLQGIRQTKVPCTYCVQYAFCAVLVCEKKLSYSTL